MTTRSTTYSNASAGQLEVIFSGAWDISVSSDPGFPATGSADMRLECIVSNGSTLARVYIDRTSPSAHVLLDYPGGSTSWTVTMANVYQAYGGGIGSIEVTPRVSFILVKR